MSTLPNAERRKLPDRASLREQLEAMRDLEFMIAKKRIEESYARVLKDADEAFELPLPRGDGGQ